MPRDRLEDLMKSIDDFARERDWSRFHTPSLLSMSVSIEAAELMEIFQWMSPSESSEAVANSEIREALSDEVADVLIYLLRLCSVAGIDPIKAATSKLERNRSRTWDR
jgi:NTP pyrophosphatase (non-canonical NTP hydrolase)